MLRVVAAEYGTEAMKILAVDDDPVALDILGATLTRANYLDLTLASSAEKALEKLGKTDVPFDCCLLDIQMPGIDGIELCAAIRDMPDYRHAPIVMITSLSDQGSIDRAYAAGATDYVTKPFNGLELGSRIRVAGILCAHVHEHKQYMEQMKYTQTVTGGATAQDAGFLKLENTVLRASENDLSNYVIALEIIGIDFAAVHSGLSAEVCQLITATAGSAITNIAYDGENRFLLTAARPAVLTPQTKQTLRGDILDILKTRYEAAHIGEIKIRMGKSIQISTFDVSSRLGCIAQARKSIQMTDLRVQGEQAMRNMRPSVSSLEAGDNPEMIPDMVPDASIILSRPKSRGGKRPLKRPPRTVISDIQPD
jgi:CheY-like chemotaxis protein